MGVYYLVCGGEDSKCQLRGLGYRLEAIWIWVEASGLRGSRLQRSFEFRGFGFSLGGSGKGQGLGFSFFFITLFAAPPSLKNPSKTCRILWWPLARDPSSTWVVVGLRVHVAK